MSQFASCLFLNPCAAATRCPCWPRGAAFVRSIAETSIFQEPVFVIKFHVALE